MDTPTIDPAVTDFQNRDDIYTRDFYTIDVSNTIGDWVDAFNNNALASTDHTWYLGEMLFNGLLYTGRETIGGQTAVPFTNLNISSVPITELVLDNLYVYFRDINKIKLIDHLTVDLSGYNNGQPMFFYLNSALGFRVTQEFNQHADEVMLFRFIINNGIFSQCYLTAQRFGSNVYDAAKEFYTVQGCQPLPVGSAYPMSIKLDDGQIKRSGIEINNHQIPDIHEIEDNAIPFNLRYIELDNTVDYTKATTYNVDPNHYLTYAAATLNNVTTGYYTVQRILYDVYENCLIMQYGDSEYPTLQDALSSVDNVSYPFPYDELMYIPLGLMFIKQGITSITNDVTHPDNCILVQHLNTTTSNTDSAFFAEDSYARGRLEALNNDISVLQQLVAGLRQDINNMPNTLKQPQSQGGLGDYWIRKNVADSTTGKLTMSGGSDVTGGHLNVPSVVDNSGNETNLIKAGAKYIMINGQRLYLGYKPTAVVSNEDWWAIYPD